MLAVTTLLYFLLCYSQKLSRLASSLFLVFATGIVVLFTMLGSHFHKIAINLEFAPKIMIYIARLENIFIYNYHAKNDVHR